MTTVAQEVGKWLLGILQGAAGGAFGAITAAILFLYVFLSLLTNRDKVLLLIRGSTRSARRSPTSTWRRWAQWSRAPSWGSS